MTFDVTYKANQMKNFISIILTASALFGISACTMGNTSIANEDNSTLQKTVVVGKTTQSEIFQLFGEPSIKSLASDGTETWHYTMADTKWSTYVPFADIIAGGSSVESKDLTIKFKDRIVIHRELSTRKDIIRESPENKAAQDSSTTKPQKSNNTTSPTNPPSQINTITGLYENRSESDFIFTLQLNKDSSVVYEEFDSEGGKPLKLRGRWKKNGNQLELNFGKNGVYKYSIETNLAWSDFGCKGGSFGFKNISVPKSQGAGNSIVHNVWRKSDLRTADKCQAL